MGECVSVQMSNGRIVSDPCSWTGYVHTWSYKEIFRVPCTLSKSLQSGPQMKVSCLCIGNQYSPPSDQGTQTRSLPLVGMHPFRVKPFRDPTILSYGESVALLVARRTNNWKVVGSMPANVVCITCWQVTAWGKLSAVPGHHSLFRAVSSWSLRLSALMDSDMAWVNGKSNRWSWCYADVFKRSIISGAIYHLFIL